MLLFVGQPSSKSNSSRYWNRPISRTGWVSYKICLVGGLWGVGKEIKVTRYVWLGEGGELGRKSKLQDLFGWGKVGSWEGNQSYKICLVWGRWGVGKEIKVTRFVWFGEGGELGRKSKLQDLFGWGKVGSWEGNQSYKIYLVGGSRGVSKEIKVTRFVWLGEGGELVRKSKLQDLFGWGTVGSWGKTKLQDLFGWGTVGSWEGNQSYKICLVGGRWGVGKEIKVTRFIWLG